MGRSRMKPDETTKSAGYAAVFGFNLRRLARCLVGEVRPKVDVVNNIAANNVNIIEKNEHAIGMIEMDGFTLILARR